MQKVERPLQRGHAQDVRGPHLQPARPLGRLEDVGHGELPILPAPGRPAIRIHSARTVHVDIRRSAFSLEDGRESADGLKAGKQQLVNLEKTPPQTSDRLVDFLSGVTYALDGTVERIGEKVYLFAPANVQIELDSSEPETQPTRSY